MTHMTALVQCEQFYQIGIYSNCTDKVNRTILNKEAGLVSDFNRDIIQQIRSYHRNVIIRDYDDHKFVYEEYNVCKNITYMAEIVEELILNERYRIQDKNKNYSDSAIIDIWTHASVKMVAFVKSTFPNIPVYDNDYRNQTDGSIYDPLADLVKGLVRLIQYFKWEKVLLVSVTESEFPFSHKLYFRKALATLQKTNICLKLYTINPDSVNNETAFIRRISNTKERLPTLMFGSKRMQCLSIIKILDLLRQMPLFTIITTPRSTPFINFE